MTAENVRTNKTMIKFFMVPSPFSVYNCEVTISGIGDAVVKLDNVIVGRHGEQISVMLAVELGFVSIV